MTVYCNFLLQGLQVAQRMAEAFDLQDFRKEGPNLIWQKPETYAECIACKDGYRCFHSEM